MKYLCVGWDFTDGRNPEYRWNVSELKHSELVAPRCNMSTDAEYNNNNDNNNNILLTS